MRERPGMVSTSLPFSSRLDANPTAHARAGGPRCRVAGPSIRTGDTSAELIRYTAENTVDLAIVRGADEHSRAFAENGRCSVLILRP